MPARRWPTVADRSERHGAGPGEEGSIAVPSVGPVTN